MPNHGVSPRVLVVDDECVIADTLALILNKSGFETHAVYSGETALEAAITLQPNVLISDVIMHGMSGIDAAIRISAHLPGCRVILFSGNATTSNLLQEAEAHGHHFEMLAKPIHPRTLLDRLSSPEQVVTA